MALRALVPQGYMLGEADSGAPVIEICTGYGVQTVTIDPDTGEARVVSPQAPSGDGTHEADNPCPFAVAALGAFYSLPAAPPQRTTYTQPAYAPAPQSRTTAFERPAPPARGPPLSA